MGGRAGWGKAERWYSKIRPKEMQIGVRFPKWQNGRGTHTYMAAKMAGVGGWREWAQERRGGIVRYDGTVNEMRLFKQRMTE